MNPDLTRPRHLLQHEIPVDAGQDVLLHVVHGEPLLALVEGKCLQGAQVEVELGHDALPVAGEQRTRRVAVVLREGSGLFNDALNTFYLQKEGNVLFKDARNTFYLRLYGVRHMVKDHSVSERKEGRKCFI